MHIDDFGNEVRLSIDQRVPWRVALEILRLLKVERIGRRKAARRSKSASGLGTTETAARTAVCVAPACQTLSES